MLGEAEGACGLCRGVLDAAVEMQASPVSIIKTHQVTFPSTIFLYLFLLTLFVLSLTHMQIVSFPTFV